MFETKVNGWSTLTFKANFPPNLVLYNYAVKFILNSCLDLCLLSILSAFFCELLFSLFQLPQCAGVLLECCLHHLHDWGTHQLQDVCQSLAIDCERGRRKRRTRGRRKRRTRGRRRGGEEEEEESERGG